MKPDRQFIVRESPRVLIMDSPGHLLKISKETLIESGLEPVLYPWDPNQSRDRPRPTNELTVIVSGQTPVPDDIVVRASHCICIIMAGSPHTQTPCPVNIGLARRLGIYVTSVTDYAPDIISDRLLEHIHQLRGSTPIGPGYRSPRIGIIGMGSVGCRVARKALGRGLEVLWHDPFINRGIHDGCGRRMTSREDLVGISDIITLHLPINDSTRGMISSMELGLMRRNSVLLNISDPDLVDKTAIEAVLSAGKKIEYHLIPKPGSPSNSRLFDTKLARIRHIDRHMFEPGNASILRYEKAMRIIIDLYRGIRPGHLLADPAFPRHEMLVSRYLGKAFSPDMVNPDSGKC